jgi:hypothetical protein
MYMKSLGITAVISIFVWFGAMPAAGHDCGHHNNYYGDCWDCGHHGNSASPSRRSPAPSGETAKLQTVEGKIAEVVYLSGATAESGMVEIRIQAAGQVKLVRLAPAGFLKQGGLHLREGDAVVVKGFPVAGMDGDLIVATEVHKGDLTLPLRDTQGRSAW